MTRDSPMAVDISSDDSCSAGDDDGDHSNKRPRHDGAIDKPFIELTYEGIFVLYLLIPRICLVEYPCTLTDFQLD